MGTGGVFVRGAAIGLIVIADQWQPHPLMWLVAGVPLLDSVKRMHIELEAPRASWSTEQQTLHRRHATSAIQQQ